MGIIKPASVNFTGDNSIRQGSTFDPSIPLEDAAGDPYDLSAWVGSGKGVRCQMRENISSSTIIATPTVTIQSPATDGVLLFVLTSTQTEGITVGNGVFDIELFNNNVSPPEVRRIVEGQWSLSLEVTR